MFALFNLGLIELVILGMLGLLTLGVVAGIILLVVRSGRGRRSEEDNEN